MTPLGVHRSHLAVQDQALPGAVRCGVCLRYVAMAADHTTALGGEPCSGPVRIKGVPPLTWRRWRRLARPNEVTGEFGSPKSPG